MTKLIIFLIFIATASAFYDYSDDSQMHPKFRSSGRLNGVDGPEEEWDKSYWINNAQASLQEHLNKQSTHKAKNVIFFIGDGMGVPTVMAARTLMGQREGRVGENEQLSFEKFPVAGLINTYCVDGQVADSACSATAYLGGVKANDGTIGVDANVRYQDCEAMMNTSLHVKSIAHLAIESGKSAGIVTTTRVTHASPAGAYAHTSCRTWENDGLINTAVGPNPVCTDVAHQLITDEPGRSFKVILGGGRIQFVPPSEGGYRDDGRNLIEEWQEGKSGESFRYVTDKTQLQDAVDSDTDYLFGLFAPSHLVYHMLADNTVQPTLEEMTEAAIRTLSKNEEGFFLFVEGGRIDHGHHDNQAHLALDETIEMSKAIDKALELTDSTETLIIVSADHSHVMTVSGYPSRGNDILGVSDGDLDAEGLETLTLTYANGPGFREAYIFNETHTAREDLAKDTDFINREPTFQYPGLFPLSSETHGGEDVPLYAFGPWQHLFTGAYEQNLIPHMLAYAMCVGDGLTMCSGSAITSLHTNLLIIVLVNIALHYFYNKH